MRLVLLAVAGLALLAARVDSVSAATACSKKAAVSAVLASSLPQYYKDEGGPDPGALWRA